MNVDRKVQMYVGFKIGLKVGGRVSGLVRIGNIILARVVLNLL